MALRRYVALLRGINVGGKNKLPMKELVALIDKLGAEEISTYIQSGNVLHRAPAEAAKRLPQRLQRAIAEGYGYEIPIVQRDAATLKRIVQENPFGGEPPKSLHVALLEPTPSTQAFAALDPDRSPPDRFAPGQGVLYLCCPNGIGRSKLTTAYLERTLDVTVTVRNWRTVNALVDRMR